MKDQIERQNRTKQHLEDKAYREEQIRLENEQMVSRMEQEELELIQKLQTTQLLQKAAYEDLENALGTAGNTSNMRPGS